MKYSYKKYVKLRFYFLIDNDMKESSFNNNQLI